MSWASWTQFFGLLNWHDAVDILAVTVVIYNLLLLIRGTRAVQVLLGIVFVGLVYYAARWAELVTLQTILESLLIALPFAIIVTFQQRMRVASDIVLAATTLSSRRIGGLIVIERLQGLRTYVENGIALDAVLSFDLLLNIFTPDTPLHDGAVIVQEDRIAAAACFLPLSTNPSLSKDLGTRHRAALGITEETDAVALVISEETGIISVACDGKIVRDLDGKSLRNSLYKYLITDVAPAGPTGPTGRNIAG